MPYAKIIGIIWLIFFASWLLAGFGAKKTTRKTNPWRARGFQLIALIIVLIVISNFPILRNFGTHNPFLGMLGIIICLLGFGLAIWARFYLGRNWGMPMTLKENHELVISGPYRFIRHPIYSGFLLAMLGSALATDLSWLLIFVVLGIYFIYSARTEEKIMEQQFPAQYPEYKKKTKALIPFVW